MSGIAAALVEKDELLKSVWPDTFVEEATLRTQTKVTETPSLLAGLKEQSRSLTLAERTELSCGLAKTLEKAGEYEAAGEALNEFWPEPDRPPTLEGLDEATQAAVLLRVGSLAGWQGGADQTAGSQEIAKDLITIR